MNFSDKDVQKYIRLVREMNDTDKVNGIIRSCCVITFGCQQNEADSEKIRGIAEEMGYEITDSRDADFVMVNTCAIREHAELRAFSAIGELKHSKADNKEMIIGVCGCMTAQRDRVDKLKHRFENVDFTLEPNSIYKIPMLVYYMRSTEKRKRTFIAGDDDGTVFEGLPVKRDFTHRAWVSIMYGCNNFCSYCIVPYVRGRERSRASVDIINEIKELISVGCKDITLLGQNVNSYKSDCDFTELITRISHLEGDFIVRFMTSHPKDVPDSLINAIADSNGKIEPHFHLPLQSGSDRILKSMNRKYTVDRYLSIVEKLKTKIPDISITTDIIVGYPEETREDFEKTLDVIRKVGFDMIFSFIYSPRKGTPAAEMTQIPDAVKNERFAEMTELQNELSRESAKRFIGKRMRVLVDGESRENSDIYSGRTDANRIVHFKATKNDIGIFKYVKIEKADSYVMYGTLED